MRMDGNGECGLDMYAGQQGVMGSA